MILFSVLIPVYNVEKYLVECIESVLAQTYPNFELILVDDGSTDNSGRICDEYAEKDGRITVIHQPNGGLLMARRRAIAQAKGDYLLHLDSDDYWDSNLLEIINNTIKASRCDMVIFRLRWVSDLGAVLNESPSLYKDQTVFVPENKELLFQTVIKDGLNNLCNKVISRAIIDDTDYTPYRHIKNAEDLLQSLPLLAHAQCIVYLDRALYNYRQNPSSITNNFNKDLYKNTAVVHGVTARYLKELGFDSEQNLVIFETKYLKSILSYIYSLMNSTLTHKEKKAILTEIRSSCSYNNAISYDRKALSGSERMRLFLFQKKSSFLLYLLCRAINFKVKIFKGC
ncbi:glycosyltransferase family 2 protein [Acetanaerobacterium elongatum]|uniref:Glycosyltransferase involved in cell wall bisynthesis n=1 Tax=Acetanaerobacterium elongatum TaxID=258515 RepID=A0A1G9Z3X2_9FIRM|nr:glycosyltransferase family 2 protein [Acetanaerobacterium elongatum]SDN16032.1 Glycosyltransferase involved in cell wall bisynthesis [Acetanaerobacterium elongatum]